MIIILICLILCVCGCVHDFKNEDHDDAWDVVLAIVSYFLSCLISICIGCMICCVLQLFLPNSLEDENYSVSDVYFSNELVPESFENTHIVKFLATDSDGENTKITASMSNIRVEYSDNTTDTVITKYKAYSFKKWYRYIYDSPNEFYYVITFPQYKAVGEETEEEATTIEMIINTQENTTTTIEETTTTTTEETATSMTITTITTAETATTTTKAAQPTTNGLTCLGTFIGTYYAGRTVPCRGGSGRTLIDCTVGSNDIKGSVASRYIYKNYGYNRNGTRTKIYIEFESIPSMNGWYYVDDCNADNTIIDFYFYYNSNCPWSRAGVTSIKAYI